MKISSLFASVRSFRILSVALPMAALLCSAPLTRAAHADSTPHIYLFDAVLGVTDVTATFDGSSVISPTGDVIYVSLVSVPDSVITGAGGHTTDSSPNDPLSIITGAGGHTTDSSPNDPNSVITGAGGHTTDCVITGAGGHTTDLYLDGVGCAIVGIVAP